MRGNGSVPARLTSSGVWSRRSPFPARAHVFGTQASETASHSSRSKRSFLARLATGRPWPHAVTLEFRRGARRPSDAVAGANPAFATLAPATAGSGWKPMRRCLCGALGPPVVRRCLLRGLGSNATPGAEPAPKRRMLELCLVRHGQSEGNVAYAKSVRGDNSLYSGEFLNRHSSLWRLTDRGRREAAEAGRWLRRHGDTFDAYYTSEFLRVAASPAGAARARSLGRSRRGRSLARGARHEGRGGARARAQARHGDGGAPGHGGRAVVHGDQLPRARLGPVGPAVEERVGPERGPAPAAPRALLRAPRRRVARGGAAPRRPHPELPPRALPRPPRPHGLPRGAHVGLPAPLREAQPDPVPRHGRRRARRRAHPQRARPRPPRPATVPKPRPSTPARVDGRASPVRGAKSPSARLRRASCDTAASAPRPTRSTATSASCSSRPRGTTTRANAGPAGARSSRTPTPTRTSSTW